MTAEPIRPASLRTPETPAPDDARSGSPDAALARPVLRSAVAALPPYVPGRRGNSPRTAALASNESHYDPLPSVTEAVLKAAVRLNRYPDMASLALRERLSEHLAATLEEVAVGPGSVGVLQQIIASMCDAGDEVVYAWRSFEAYPILAALAGALPVEVPLRQDESHDLEAMARAITNRTRVVIVCTPNNPTGVSVNRHDLERFLQIVPSRVLVVIDEAYLEYADHPDTLDSLSVRRRHPNVCVLRTFSKAHGLAGLRVGYALAAPDLAEGIRRSAVPFAVSALAQTAAIASLAATQEMQQRVKSVSDERRRVIEAARSLGWTLPNSQANFFWLRTPEDRRQTLTDAFADANILVRSYAGDGIRISLADPKSNDRVLRVLSAEAPAVHPH